MACICESVKSIVLICFWYLYRNFFKPRESYTLKISCSYTLSLITLLALFIFFPVGSKSIDLVTGFERVVLSLLSILIVLNIYIFQFSIKGFLGDVLLFFGRCCYSIYLIHPIVALPLSFVLHDKLGVNLVATYVLSAVITLILSAIIYEKIEKPMMELGKKLAKRKQEKECWDMKSVSVSEDL